MANYIPRIEYTEFGTGTPKTITFSHPPSEDPFNEHIVPNARSSRSTNGTRQTQHNYNLRVFEINFQFESKAIKDAVEDMVLNHTSRGGTVNYFPSDDEVEFFTGHVVDSRPSFARPAPDESISDFVYDFKLTLEIVV